MEKNSNQIWRLCFRVEGAFYNTYLAHKSLNEKSAFLGGIVLAFVHGPQNDLNRARFTSLMEEAARSLIASKLNFDIVFGKIEAPLEGVKNEDSG